MVELVNPDLERAVIGCAMAGRTALLDLTGVFPEHFTDLRHAALWRLITQMDEAGELVTVQTVSANLKRIPEQNRRGVDGMQPVNAVNLPVALDVLTQRAAKIDVEDLQPAADADDYLSRAQEVVNQRELTRVACFVEIFRAVQRLTVKARVHVAPAGQQQNVRVLRRFGERRTDQRERIFVIFQAYR